MEVEEDMTTEIYATTLKNTVMFYIPQNARISVTEVR